MWPPEINRRRYGKSIGVSNPGLNAWPSRWLTPTKGFSENAAIDLPMFRPIVKQTVKPGPAVAATPSIWLKLILLFSKACLTI